MSKYDPKSGAIVENIDLEYGNGGLGRRATISKQN